jgi:hypothetical protein
LVKHEVEEQAWRLEEVGIMCKSDLQKLWSGDEDLFGESGYSRGSLKILKKSLHEYGPSGAAGGTGDVVDAGTNVQAPKESERKQSKQPKESNSGKQAEEQRPCAKCGMLFPASDVAGHEERRLNGHRLEQGRWCEGRRRWFGVSYPKTGGEINEGDPRCLKQVYLDEEY